MFFRCKQSPSGQCLQLLEAYRNAQGQPRHRVVVSLGDATIPEADWPRIARLVEQRLRGQAELQGVSDPAGVLGWADTIAKRIEREGAGVRFRQGGAQGRARGPTLSSMACWPSRSPTPYHGPGPSLVAWHAWQQLGLPALLDTLEFNPAQAHAAAVSVISRLVDPGSELALVDWLPDSSLPELMRLEIGPAAKDRFYRVSDRLFEDRQASRSICARGRANSSTRTGRSCSTI